MGLESMDLFGENSEGSQPIMNENTKILYLGIFLSVGRI